MPEAPVPKDASLGEPALSRRSLWAVVGLLFSLGVFCPFLTLLGPLFGMRALVQIRANPNITGRRLAMAAVIIGIVASCGWVAALMLWNEHARRPMLYGPEVELQLAIAGDAQPLHALMMNDDGALTLDDVRAFALELNDRYGVLRNIEQDHFRLNDSARLTNGASRIPYILHFNDIDVRAEGRFVIFKDGRFPLRLQYEWFTVRDDVLGDLVLPAAAAHLIPQAPPASEAPASEVP